MSLKQVPDPLNSTLLGSRCIQTAVVYCGKQRQHGSLWPDVWVQQTERSYYTLSNSPLGSHCPSWCVFPTQFHPPMKRVGVGISGRETVNSHLRYPEVKSARFKRSHGTGALSRIRFHLTAEGCCGLLWGYCQLQLTTAPHPIHFCFILSKCAQLCTMAGSALCVPPKESSVWLQSEGF